jgi:hypothetical protein
MVLTKEYRFLLFGTGTSEVLRTSVLVTCFVRVS